MKILPDIKKILGIHEDLPTFDSEILMHINSAFSILVQNGLADHTILIDENSEWEEYVPVNLIGLVEHYVYLYVRTLFDTSTTASYVLECMRKQAEEDLWRIREEIETNEYEQTS